MSDRPIILFDGVCNLCDGFVQFVIRHDAAGKFRFASLQSEVGAEILQQHNLPKDQLSSVVLSDGDRFYVKSNAALRVIKELSAPWNWLGLLLVLPRSLRDWGYDWIASHRYRWFGRRDSCMMPTPELRERFL